MATKAQKWARKRNYSKHRLKGMIGQAESMIGHGSVLTDGERIELKKATNTLLSLESKWDGQTPVSKKKFV